MPLGTHQKMPSTRTIAALCLGLFLIWTSAYAQQLSGRVINRDGRPQPGCQIEFYQNPNAPPLYRLVSNGDGFFYLPPNPREGQYTVWVRQGQQGFPISVTIDVYGLHPSTFVVTW